MTLLHQAAQKAVEALKAAQRAINSMKVEAETAAAGGDEQMLQDACETISAEGLEADTELRDAIAQLSAALQQQPEPVAAIGWLYDWTHSSALGKPDEQFTSFTTDEAHARKHDNPRAVYTAPPALQHQEVPSDKQIARAFADEQMRQGSGTHNRHEWFRRGALWAASPSTTRQQEVGSGVAYVGPPDWLRLAQECGGTVYRHRSDPQSPGVAFGDESWARFVAALSAVVRAAAPSTPEKAGGVSDGVGACPGCGRFYPVHLPGCPHVVSASVSHPLPAQANDGGEHG